MSAVAEQFKTIKSGKTKRIRGQDIKRDGDNYIIDGTDYLLDEAIKKVEESGRSSSIDYAWTAFFECQHYSKIPIKQYRCKDRAQHHELVEAVKKRNNVLYYCSVRKDGNKYFANPIMIIDWDSLPEPDEIKPAAKPIKPAKWDGGLSCPFCAKKVSSTPGRTLHVKSEHPERLSEYFGLLNPPSRQLDDDGDDDVVDQLQSVVGLQCPFCSKSVSSTSGRTLHVKNCHPERFTEYQQK